MSKELEAYGKVALQVPSILAIARSKETPHPTVVKTTCLPADRKSMAIAAPIISPWRCSSSPARLTVWRKSLLFNGNGYTVFDDSNGRMVFRVENYACNQREEAFLMDFAGNVLLTIRRCRKKLGISESWEAYKGEKDVLKLGGLQKPLFRTTKSFGNSSYKMSLAAGDDYRMNWSRQNGWSKIYRSTPDALPVAEINRKCGSFPKILLGKDVLTVAVQPGMDQVIVMAMIMISDAMK